MLSYNQLDRILILKINTISSLMAAISMEKTIKKKQDTE